MALGVSAQGTPSASPSSASPMASPVAIGTNPVDDLGCWAGDPNWDAGYPQWDGPPEMKIDTSKTYYATIETNRGTFVIELYDDAAPNTVNNFVCLATNDYYNGVTFHRILATFMVQTGDPTGTGQGGPGYTINDELPGDDLDYREGIVAMANAGPNTGGSQFFINTVYNAGKLDKTYTIFGNVVEGMDVVKRISLTPVRMNAGGTEQSAPAATITILNVTITSN